MILLHKYSDLFSETCQTVKADKINLSDHIDKDKRYIIVINDKDMVYPSFGRRLPKLKNGDIASLRQIPEGASEAFGAVGMAGGLLLALGGILAAFTFGASVLMMIAGAAMIATGTIGQLLTKPKDQKGENGFEKGYGFSGAGNQISKDKPFPVIFGTRRITPPIVGQYYTFSQNNADKPEQYLTALFCLGHGKISIKDIRMGDTIIASNSGNINSGIIPLSTQTVTATLEIRQGSLPSIYNTRKSMESISAALEHNGNDKIVKIERAVPSGAVSVDVETAFLQGIYYYNGHRGRYDGSGVGIVCEFYNAYGSLVFSHTLIHESNQKKELRYTDNISISGLNVSKMIIYADRKTIEHGSDKYNSTTVNLPTLLSLAYNFNESPVSASIVPKMTFLAMRVKADANTNGAIDKINCIASSLIPTWNGSNWNSLIVSSNPSAIALAMIRGAYLAKPVPDNKIDFQEFQTVYEWCEKASVPYRGNFLIEDQGTFLDKINDVLALCQGTLVIKNAKYSIAHDRKRDTALAVISPKNSRNFQSTISTEDLPTAVRITFCNEAAAFEEDEVTVTLVNESAGDNIILIKSPGITSYGMCNNFGRYLLATGRNRLERFSCEVPIYHYALPIGGRVKLQHFSVLVGLASGRITNVDMVNNVLFLDENLVNLELSKKYGLQILVGLGDIVSLEVKPLETANTVEIVGGKAKSEYAGKTYAFGEYKKETLDCIIKAKRRMSSPRYAAELEFVPYSEEIFAAINAPLKPYEPSITIPGKPISNEVYKEPPRAGNPSDDIISVAPDGSIEIGGESLGAITDTTPPVDIESVSAVPRTNGTISVRWSSTEDEEGGSGLAGYKIYRGKNSDKSDKYIHMYGGVSDKEAQDTATVLGESYFYDVSAYDRNNNESNITWIKEPVLSQNVIPPEIPHNLTGKALKGEIRLEWVAPTNAGNITYYEIWKRSGLSDAHEWEVLGRSGTLSYIETIGQVEALEIKGWRYKVRAYNLYETYGQFDTENGSSVDLSEYGTYIKTPIMPQLTAVGDSINISWAKQYDLMDFKAWQIQVSRNGTDWYSLDFKGENPTMIEKDTFTETASPIIHGSLFLDKEAVETDGETQYVPIPTLYKYRMRQVSESGEALDWSDENTPVAEVYAEPIDILKLNVGNLSVNDGKFLSMRGGSMLGFAKDDNLPESQRISTEDTTLNYLDLTNNKMRFGTLNSFMLVDYAKGLVAFKGTELQLDQSSLTTNADGVYLKHEGNSLTWGDSDFSIKYAGIKVNATGMTIENTANITLPANVKIGETLFKYTSNGLSIENTPNIRLDANGMSISGRMGISTTLSADYALTVGGKSFFHGEIKMKSSVGIYTRYLDGGLDGLDGDLFLNYMTRKNVYLCFNGGSVGIRTSADSNYSLKVEGRVYINGYAGQYALTSNVGISLGGSSYMWTLNVGYELSSHYLKTNWVNFNTKSYDDMRYNIVLGAITFCRDNGWLCYCNGSHWYKSNGESIL